jgi:hypothetical protein
MLLGVKAVSGFCRPSRERLKDKPVDVADADL